MRNENRSIIVAKIAGLFSIAGWVIGASMSVTSFARKDYGPVPLTGRCAPLVLSAQLSTVV